MSSGDQTKRVLRLHSDIARVMSDGRFDRRRHGAELRHFIVSYFWASFECRDSDERWKRVLQLSGLSDRRDVEYALRQLFAYDAPRYEPESLFGYPVCKELMQRGPRAGDECGKHSTFSTRVTDLSTGEWEMQGWCSNHRRLGELYQQSSRHAPTAPEPLPNTGGLLPGYIRASNWPDLYAAALYGWKPPSVGINADDWPVLAKVQAHVRPVFTSLDGGCEKSAAELPRLRLVT